MKLSAAGPPPAAFKPLLDTLREAVTIEHLTMLEYLYAAFSIKPRAAEIRGPGGGSSAQHLFGIAVQEMQHLHAANLFLRFLGAPPHVDRDPFPRNYLRRPFGFEPLSRRTAWKYAELEAPANALPQLYRDRDDDGELASAFDEALDRKLRAPSLYAKLRSELEAAFEAAPESFGTRGIEPWLRKLERIQHEGEEDHFLFFRSLYTGTHPAFRSGSLTWTRSDDLRYPAHQLRIAPANDPDESARLLTDLADHTYWMTCVLLHSSYLDEVWLGDPDEEYQTTAFAKLQFWRARNLMRSCLLPLGLAMADVGLGVPFRRLPEGKNPLATTDNTVVTATLRMFARESEAIATNLGRKLRLPDAFDVATIRELFT